MRISKFPDAPPLPESDYRVAFTRLGGPAAHEQVYWHLFYRGERVNGGIAGNRELAFADACHKKVQHFQGEWTA